MTAAALIEEARADGLELRPNGDKLKLRGPAAAVEKWKPRLAAIKPEIMDLLSPIPPDLEHLIVRAGAHWMYSPDDYALIREVARRDPGGLRLALENDVAFSASASSRHEPASSKRKRREVAP
ncbi:MAG: hypothetical protein Q8M09_20645 [Pseudomonadota bacterium]|nr:hypothetical protein [Pseudomonadota bacterium]MDP2351685.1 hypothetical protein [Pseudomonadota bacterium]